MWRSSKRRAQARARTNLLDFGELHCEWNFVASPKTDCPTSLGTTTSLRAATQRHVWCFQCIAGPFLREAEKQGYRRVNTEHSLTSEETFSKVLAADRRQRCHQKGNKRKLQAKFCHQKGKRRKFLDHFFTIQKFINSNLNCKWCSRNMNNHHAVQELFNKCKLGISCN